MLETTSNTAYMGLAKPSESGGGGNLTTLRATPTTSAQDIYPPSGFDGFSRVTVEPVTSTIDANIQPENIKKNISILNVQGTYTGGKKYKLFDRIVDDTNTDIGIVSGFFIDNFNREYAVVCLNAKYRQLTYHIINPAIEITGLPWCGDTRVFSTPETATFNTDKIYQTYLANPGSTSAAEMARKPSRRFTIEGTDYQAQIPNLVELIDMFKFANRINSYDPTISEYGNLRLGSQQGWWSSTQVGSTQAWQMTTGGQIMKRVKNDSTGNFAYILEIPNV